jgi:hypothetical protein
MIMGTQVEQYLKDLKHRPIRTTEKDDFPDLLFFASGFYQ